MAKFQKKSQYEQTPIILSETGKPPPQCIDIEQSVLGTIINDYHLIAKYPYLKPEVFYKETHQIIFKALVDLYNNDIQPDLLILTDHLITIKDIEKVGGVVYLTKLSSQSLINIDNHVKIIMDKYFYRELIRITYFVQRDSFDGTKDPLDIMDEMQNNILELTEFDGDVQNNFQRSLERTIGSIINASEGENITVIKTGFVSLDKRFTFRTRYVCIIAGPEGSGKTKMVTSLVRGMLDNEPELAVQWFSFEDDRDQIIRAFMSMDLKMTSKELQSINYKVSEEDIVKIKKISENYRNYNIEFYDRITSIANITSRSKRFSDKYAGKKRIIIIDNLGLIECEKSGIERDDFLAAKIKGIADNTNTAIILLHHFTKEISRRANIEDGYRPRKEYLKGSTRILDYVQQALFVNLLRKYPDLLAEEKHLQLDFIGQENIEFTEENFDKYLWSINSIGDKETTSLTDIRMETFIKLKTLLNNKTRFANGNIITFSDIVQKYSEYSHYVDTRNKGREEKYKTQKISIYIFIIKRKFNENYTTSDNSPRSVYLYGRNKELRHHIDNLFIVESIKNRDDDNLNENAIFRFITDLGYNLFKEIDTNGNF